MRVMNAYEHPPIPTPKVHITIEVRDRTGKVIHRRRERGHSWTRNYYVILVAQAGWVEGTEEMGTRLRTVGGSWIEKANHFPRLEDDSYVEGGSGNTSRGIVIGTGSTPPTIDDYKLEALIPHGTGEGQMLYNAQADTVNEVISGGWRTTLVRQFNNNSGASIYVAETGIYAFVAFWGSNAYMLCRNVHDPAVEVPHGGLLTVTYTVEVAQPW